MSQMPTEYLARSGLPLFWMNEASGQLQAAMQAYLDGTMTPEQTELVIDYFRYFIQAPCWESAPDGAGYLAELRALAAAMDTPADIHAFVGRCLEFGIDPI